MSRSTKESIGQEVSSDDTIARILAASEKAGNTSPAEFAANEDFWRVVQQAYDCDRSLVNLNNGGVAPAPRCVLDAMHRHVEFTNNLPARNLWDILDLKVEAVRERLARTFGCDTDEIAITRNSSESLEICILGLDLQRGDEILTTSQDYPRMLTTLRQRELRDGVVVRTFPIPTPPDDPAEIAELFEKSITDRTKVILVSHVMFMTGQITPVKAIVDLGRARGIEVIVDGAQAFAHLAFKHSELDCDYYGTSLHKWLSAPIGTGLLYVRRSKIANLWPLMPAKQPRSDDIRKFEEIGTHPTAPRLAIGEALSFYEAVGPERKEARLRYLRDRWAMRLQRHDRVRFYTSLDPTQSCGLGTIGVEGFKGADLARDLLAKHRIFVTPLDDEGLGAIRMTPNTYTTLEEIDQFSEAMDEILAQDLPSQYGSPGLGSRPTESF